VSGNSLPVEPVLALLAENPSRLATLTAGLTLAQLHAPLKEGEWSLNDILAHLRSCSDMWGDCIVKILAEDKPTLRAINPVTWMKQTDYPKQKFRTSLRLYTEQRTKLLTVLEPIKSKVWSRSATVTGAGKPLQRTVFFYAQWLAHHERSHLTLIARFIKTLNA
jgi:DinB superfamily